jgi:hypothetical protein
MPFISLQSSYARSVPIIPFNFCDPLQWQDSDSNTPPVPWELITPDSNAYEWDETDLYTNSPITYVGNDSLPASLEIFYAYIQGDAFAAAQLLWRWLDGSELELDSGSQFLPDGTGSVVIGPPPVGAVTMQFEVSGPFFWGVGTYGTYLVLGCNEDVWELIVGPDFNFCDPTQWRDGFSNTPPSNWEALATDGRYWFDDNAGLPFSLTYVNNSPLPNSFDIEWEITQYASHIVQMEVNLNGTITTYNLGESVGSGTVTINPPTPNSPLQITMRTDFGSQLYGTVVALGCPEPAT